jgi:hypothetical protein
MRQQKTAMLQSSEGCSERNSRKEYVMAYLRECLEAVRRSQGEPQWRVPTLRSEFRVTPDGKLRESGSYCPMERVSEQQRTEHESIGRRQAGH